MKLGSSIKKARNLRSLTQQELAQRLEVSATYISLLENDKRDPSWSFLCRLAETLDLPVALLVLMASSEDESASATSRALGDRLSAAILPALLMTDAG